MITELCKHTSGLWGPHSGADLYSNELTTLLKTVTEFPYLKQPTVNLLFPLDSCCLHVTLMTIKKSGKHRRKTKLWILKFKEHFHISEVPSHLSKIAKGLRDWTQNLKKKSLQIPCFLAVLQTRVLFHDWNSVRSSKRALPRKEKNQPLKTFNRGPLEFPRNASPIVPLGRWFFPPPGDHWLCWSLYSYPVPTRATR